MLQRAFPRQCLKFASMSQISVTPRVRAESGSMESNSTNGSNGIPSAIVDCPGESAAADSSKSSGSAQWELSGGLTPNAPVQRILVSLQPFTIGRDFDNSLCLANPTISRRHAELVLAGTDLLVRDLGSRNGTYLNGRRIENFERLQDGDMLQFGAA